MEVAPRYTLFTLLTLLTWFTLLTLLTLFTLFILFTNIAVVAHNELWELFAGRTDGWDGSYPLYCYNS